VNEPAPERQIYLVRHGETEWSRSGQHTGRTDIPLTPLGKEQALDLGRRLTGHPFALVLTSPLSRAAETARLAGFGDAERADDLMEWDYGEFEGRTTADIREGLPEWTIWAGPWRGGETADQVGARADRVLAHCLDPAVEGDSLLFAHGHVLRVLTARWLGLHARQGGLFALGTATIGILGWERSTHVIETWNEACHLEDDRSTSGYRLETQEDGMDFNGILIGSDDPQALADYYRKLLGEPGWDDGGYIGWMIGSGGITIGPHSEVHGKNAQPGRIIWNIQSDDVKGDFERFKAAGATVIREPYNFEEAPDSWVATFADPDDNYFQLVSPMS
jgi:broad specificity phosphatase PhoE/predicted enzyme related to lactoylglutathione lyase